MLSSEKKKEKANVSRHLTSIRRVAKRKTSLFAKDEAIHCNKADEGLVRFIRADEVGRDGLCRHAFRESRQGHVPSLHDVEASRRLRKDCLLVKAKDGHERKRRTTIFFDAIITNDDVVASEDDAKAASCPSSKAKKEGLKVVVENVDYNGYSGHADIGDIASVEKDEDSNIATLENVKEDTLKSIVDESGNIKVRIRDNVLDAGQEEKEGREEVVLRHNNGHGDVIISSMAYTVLVRTSATRHDAS